MKRTLVRLQPTGGYKPVPYVDEEALENINLRIHTDEDQPAAIQVEDDEQVAYFDETTGFFYDCDGFLLEMVLPETGSEEDIVEHAENMN